MRRRLVSVAVLFLLAALLPVSTASSAPRGAAVPGLLAPAEILRDPQGIATVVARNDHDLYFLQGWVHAEDRLFQMDLSRRQASGTRAELLGPDALAEDVQLRTIGIRRAAERGLALLSPEARAVMEAYTAGVNAWVAENPLPSDYAEVEVTEFEPWTLIDSLTVGKLIAFGLSFSLDIDRTLSYLAYQGLDEPGIDGEVLWSQDVNRSAPFDPASTSA
jgi:penicillin amidase